MKVSDKLIRFVAGWEGFRSCPYQDAVGVWTIGFGTTSASGRPVNGNTRCIRKRKARRWLREDLNTKYLPHIPRLNQLKQQEVDALASFIYNLGPRVLTDSNYSTFARRLKGHEGNTVKGRQAIYRDEFEKWVYAGGVKLPGLINRRRAEKRMAIRGDYSGRP